MRFHWRNKSNRRKRDYSYTTEYFSPQICDFSYNGASWQAEFNNSGRLKLTNWDSAYVYEFSIRSKDLSDAERTIRKFLDGECDCKFSYSID